MSWRTHRKIDAHVHVLPGERTVQFIANEGLDAPWSQCSTEDYLRRMDRFGIEKALLLPMNDQNMFYQDPYETNRFPGGLVREHPDRFFAFADVAASGAYFIEQTPYILPKLAGLYGIEQTRRILRAFGPERLVFGTDFPDGDYDVYFEILDQMDFSDEEIDRIAWKNIMKLLTLEDAG